MIQTVFSSTPVNTVAFPILSASVTTTVTNIVTGASQSCLLTSLTANSGATSLTINTSIVLILQNRPTTPAAGAAFKAAAEGDAVTEFRYVATKEVGEKQFTFVDDSGDILPSLGATGNANLVIHVEDGSEYDMDGVVNGSVQIAPVLATRATGGHEGSSGGGCDAGLLGMGALLAVAGGLLLGKRRA
jgi:hypothetical protein